MNTKFGEDGQRAITGGGKKATQGREELLEKRKGTDRFSRGGCRKPA